LRVNGFRDEFVRIAAHGLSMSQLSPDYAFSQPIIDRALRKPARTNKKDIDEPKKEMK